MNKLKGLIFLCCMFLACTVFAGCFGSKNSSESISESGTKTEVTVTFDPCMEAYEGLKTNTPFQEKLKCRYLKAILKMQL